MSNQPRYLVNRAVINGHGLELRLDSRAMTDGYLDSRRVFYKIIPRADAKRHDLTPEDLVTFGRVEVRAGEPGQRRASISGDLPLAPYMVRDALGEPLFNLLVTMSRTGHHRPQDLAEELGLELPKVKELLARLKSLGWGVTPRSLAAVLYGKYGGDSPAEIAAFESLLAELFDYRRRGGGSRP
jgi:hypothetical protein